MELGQKIVRDRPGALHASYSAELRELINLLLQKDDLKRPELEDLDALRRCNQAKERSPLLFPSQLKQKNTSIEADRTPLIENSKQKSHAQIISREVSNIQIHSHQSQLIESGPENHGMVSHQRKESVTGDPRGNNLESDINEEYCNERNFDLITRNFKEFSLQRQIHSKPSLSANISSNKANFESYQGDVGPKEDVNQNQEMKPGSIFKRPLRTDSKYKIKSSSKRKDKNIEALQQARETIARELKGGGGKTTGETKEENIEDTPSILTRMQMTTTKHSHRKDFLFTFNKLTVKSDAIGMLKQKRSEGDSAKTTSHVFETRQSRRSPKQSQITPLTSERAKTALAQNRAGKAKNERPISSVFKNHIIYQKEETKNRLLSALAGPKQNLAVEKLTSFFESSPMAIGRPRIDDIETVNRSIEVSRPRLRVPTAQYDRRVLSGKALSSQASDAIFRTGTNRFNYDSSYQLSVGQHVYSQKRPESSQGFKKMTIHDI